MGYQFFQFHGNKKMQIEDWEEAYLEWQKNENLDKLKESVKKWDIPKNDLVLDLCCGSGKCVNLLKREGYNNVFGLDLSKNLLSHNENLMRVLISNALVTPFKENTFDVVLMHKALHHFTNYDGILEEVRRILKPGGIFCFIEPEKTLLRLISHYLLFFTPIGYLTRNLRFLRKAVKEEKETYYLWLKNIQYFITLMKTKYNFIIIKQWSDLLHIFVKAVVKK